MLQGKHVVCQLKTETDMSHESEIVSDSLIGEFAEMSQK